MYTKYLVGRMESQAAEEKSKEERRIKKAQNAEERKAQVIARWYTIIFFIKFSTE